MTKHKRDNTIDIFGKIKGDIIKRSRKMIEQKIFNIYGYEVSSKIFGIVICEVSHPLQIRMKKDG